MSNSPSKDAELDPEAQSGEEQDHMDKDHHDVQGHPGEFEVKEQDRWLPIANGMSHLAFASDLRVPCLCPDGPLLFFSPHFFLVLSKVPVLFVLSPYI